MGLRRTIWLYLSLTAVILQSFAVPVVFMGFELNRDYISAELCVNRDMPESDCNGQCYLMKKLKQAQKDNQGTEAPNAKRDAFWQHCSSLVKRHTLLPLREILQTVPAITGHGIDLSIAIFHPPEDDTFMIAVS